MKRSDRDLRFDRIVIRPNVSFRALKKSSCRGSLYIRVHVFEILSMSAHRTRNPPPIARHSGFLDTLEVSVIPFSALFVSPDLPAPTAGPGPIE